MAQLDQLIKRMLATPGSELTLAAGHEPQLRVAGASPQTLIARKLTAPHLRLLVGELTTGASMTAIDEHDEGELTYTIVGHPPVSIQVRHWSGNLEARVRPAGAKKAAAPAAAPGRSDPRADPRTDARADARAPVDLRRAATSPAAEARARTADPRFDDEPSRAPSRPDPFEVELPPRAGGTLHGEAPDLELDTRRGASPHEPRAFEAKPAEPVAESPASERRPEPEPARRPVTVAPEASFKGRPPLPEIKPLAAGTEPPIHWLFKKMVQLKASDLHLTTGEHPRVRKDGDIIRIDEQSPRFKGSQILELLHPIMPPRNWREFEADNDTDFAYELPGISRFRANVFMDRGGVGAVFRTIPTDILTAEMLGLSQPIQNLCYLSKGLVLVTGPTGSGKSTTLAAMIDLINRQRHDHVITIEDPIEFVHPSKSCLVNQREVGNHTDSFKRALRAALREDPDVILVGELRDLETIAIAIETAETGHLVFGTLHTTTAYSTIDRVIDQFPADRQEQIRAMLSESLKGVVSQTLCKKVGGGRAAALEVLLVNSAIQNLIREGKTFQIPSVMQTARKAGMVLLNDALLELVNAKKVDVKEAYIKAVDKANFVNMCRAANHKLDFLGTETK